MQRPIFRQAALERLSSPEQLDQMTPAAPSRMGLALLAMGLLLGAGLAWSVWATLPVQVSGRGLLVSGGQAQLEALIYVNDGAERARLHPGLSVEVWPSNVSREEFGFVRGTVLSASPDPASLQAMQAALGDPDVAAQLQAEGARYAVLIALLPNAAAPSGVAWSASAGPPFQLQSGLACTASITVGQRHPIELLLRGR